MVKIQITNSVNRNISDTFNLIVPFELARIFPQYLFFPAVIRTNETQKWIEAGLTRTVFFEGGSKADEELTSVITNQSFSYTISNFTSLLRFLVERIEGEWQFNHQSDDQTNIIWTYGIQSKNFLAEIILSTIIKPILSKYLSNALEIIVNDLQLKNN